MNKSQGWCKDWSVFVGELRRLIQSGSSNADLVKMFGGHQVQWSGIVEEVDIDELSATVNVEMTAYTLSLLDGGSILLDGLTLRVAEADEPVWESYESGDEVAFVADLVNPSIPFPCIELKKLPTGKSYIMIRLENAKPVSN